MSQDIMQAIFPTDRQLHTYICLKTFLANAGAQVEVSNNILCQERYETFYYMYIKNNLQKQLYDKSTNLQQKQINFTKTNLPTNKNWTT